MAYRRHAHSQPLPEAKAACTLNAPNVQAAFRAVSKFRSVFRQAAQGFCRRFRAVQPPHGGVGNVQAALEGAECRHVRPRFGTVARKPPCQKRHPDAVPEQQAAVRQCRPCAVQEVRYAAVKFGKSVRAAACAEMRVGALPVGFRQRFAGGGIQALHGGEGQVGKLVQAGQDFRADAVSGTIGRGSFVRAAHFGNEDMAVCRQPAREFGGLSCTFGGKRDFAVEQAGAACIGGGLGVADKVEGFHVGRLSWQCGFGMQAAFSGCLNGGRSR